jgi:hypothetical protein
MKKGLILSMSVLLLLSSCGTYTETGAVTGTWFGSMIGSAIGGISGGRRGSDVGTLIGMAGGAMVGAAIGSAADKAQQEKYEDYKASRQRMRQSQQRQQDYGYQDNSGYDATNSGDDRLYGFGEDFSAVEDVNAPSTLDIRYTSLEIRHARLLDASHDGVLTRGEEARMVFEIYNNSTQPIFGVQPAVAEMTGNKHIHVSENIMIESIPAGKGMRYTASIKADNSLKDGQAVFRIGVFHRNKEISSQTQQFTIQTRKK